MFLTAVLALSQQLVDATALSDDLPVTDQDAVQTYDRPGFPGLVDAAGQLHSRRRPVGRRYLVDEDLATLTPRAVGQYATVVEPIRILRPELLPTALDPVDRGARRHRSIVEHRATPLGQPRAPTVRRMARALLWALVSVDPVHGPGLHAPGN